MSYKMRGVTEEGSEEKEGVRSLEQTGKWERVAKWRATILSSREREARIGGDKGFWEAKHFMSPLGGWEYGRLFISSKVEALNFALIIEKLLQRKIYSDVK